MLDVLSQIRDLQLAIEDFGAQESLPIAGDDDTRPHQWNSKVLYPADHEKTMVEEDGRPISDAKTSEKTLVEMITHRRPATSTATVYEPLDQVRIRFSNDFSSLVDRFTALRDQLSDKSGPRCEQETPFRITTTPGPRAGESTKQLVESELPLEHTITSTPHPHPPYSTPLDPPCSLYMATPHSRTSISSRRSRRPSAQTKKSRYFTKPTPKKEPTYNPRSYEEMMRIPDPRERIGFYEKTFKQCVRANSELVSWMDRIKAKGVPKPMTEGYQPPPRPAITMEATMAAADSTTSFNSGRSAQTHASLSSSISVFLKKASSSAATATLSRRTPFRHRAIATPRVAMGRLFLPTSMRRNSLSRPRVMATGGDSDSDSGSSPPKRSLRPVGRSPKSVRLAKWRTASSPIIKARPPTAGATPSFARIRSYKVGPASPRSFGTPMSTLARSRMATDSLVTRASLTRQKKTTPSPEVQIDSALNEMCNNLPNMDRSELEAYLKEAGGNQILAITLAMSQMKKKPAQTRYR